MEWDVQSKRRQLLQQALADPPKDFEKLNAFLQEADRAFRSEVAKLLEPALNEWTIKQPFDSLEEKRQLRSDVNQTLRELYLTVRSPDGTPGLLVLDPDSTGQKYRVRIRYQAKDGFTSHTPVAYAIPKLSLMPDVPRVESFARATRPREAGPER